MVGDQPNEPPRLRTAALLGALRESASGDMTPTTGDVVRLVLERQMGERTAGETLSAAATAAGLNPIGDTDISALRIEALAASSVGELVQDATRMQQRSGATSVHLRHVLATGVHPAVPSEALHELRLSMPELRRAWRASIARTWPDESQEGLDDILQEPRPEVESISTPPSAREQGNGERTDADATPAGARPSTAITSDAWTEHDHLEHALYADAITQFILDSKTKAPLTIGIKAPWGAGKTSLMRMIRRKLDHDIPAGTRRLVTGPRLTIWQVLRDTWRRTPAEAANELEPAPPEPSAGRTTIWFNAWKYQSGEQLWAGLAHAILSQASDRLPPRDRDRLWASVQVRRVQLPALRRAFYRYLALRLLPYALVVPLVALGVFVAWWVDPSLLHGASIVGALVAALTAAVAIVQSAMDEVTKATPHLVEEPDYESRLGFLHLVDSDMRRILEIAGATAERPFVVFVDDLDRCSYTTVAQVIEALNLFLASRVPQAREGRADVLGRATPRGW